SRPTKLEIRAGPATVFLGDDITGNPLNAREQRLLAESVNADEDDEDAIGTRYSYPLKIGDACFVAVGQIVGREYNAVRYQPTDFLEAVGWCTDPAIKDALADIVKRTDDPAIKAAIVPEKKKRP